MPKHTPVPQLVLATSGFALSTTENAQTSWPQRHIPGTTWRRAVELDESAGSHLSAAATRPISVTQASGFRLLLQPLAFCQQLAAAAAAIQL
jgi:hypothetical protein